MRVFYNDLCIYISTYMIKGQSTLVINIHSTIRIFEIVSFLENNGESTRDLCY